MTNNELKLINNTVEMLISNNFNKQISQEKYNEQYNEYYYDLLGKLAIEKYLDIEFINWAKTTENIELGSDLNNYGLNIGIINIKFGGYPLVDKNPNRGNIINYIIDESKIMIKGFANIYLLKLDSYDMFNHSKNPIIKETKTAFCGIDSLIKFKNVKTLKNISNNPLDKIYIN